MEAICLEVVDPSLTLKTMSDIETGPVPEDDAILRRRREEFFASIHTMGLEGCDTDELPGAQGEFGHEVTNPIPTHTHLGTFSYLDRLRTEDGAQVTGLHVESVASPACPHPVDRYAISAKDGTPLATLYFSPHNRRNSDKAPKGFKLQPTLRFGGRALVGVWDPPRIFSSPPAKQAGEASDPTP